MRTLTFAVLFFVAEVGHLSAQTPSPSAGGFDKLFANQGTVTPTFTRPEVLSRLPALSIQPDESPATTAASTSPPETSEPSSVADQSERKDKWVASAIKKLIIPLAEAETSPAPPPSDTPPPPEPQDTTASLTSPSQPLTTQNPLAGRPARARESQLGGGRAVWYQHSGRTASGETYNPDGLTAGHRTLPLGTRVRVVNKKNGRSVVVRINDRVNRRTQAKEGYVIDLSRGSARALGIEGVGSVALYRLD